MVEAVVNGYGMGKKVPLDDPAPDYASDAAIHIYRRLETPDRAVAEAFVGDEHDRVDTVSPKLEMNPIGGPSGPSHKIMGAEMDDNHVLRFVMANFTR